MVKVKRRSKVGERMKINHLLSQYSQKKREQTRRAEKELVTHYAIYAWLEAFPDGLKIIKADRGLLHLWQRPKGMKELVEELCASR